MDKKHIVAGIGELLWDVFPSGKQLGGAPFNFAYHCKQMGCDSYILSAIGNDESGEEIINKINNLNINSNYVQKNSYPTGTVTVNLDENGNADYIIHENVAWDNIIWNLNMNELAASLNAVCFGSLAQRNNVSAQTIFSFLIKLNSSCLKVFDINIRQHFFNKEIIVKSLQLSNVLKLNEEELLLLSGLFQLTGNVDTQLKLMINKFELNYIVYTMGSRGSIIISPDDYSFMEAPKIKVIDTVGAGDSFTAAFITGLLEKKSLNEIHKTATDVAAIVCSQKGAITDKPYLKS